MELSEYLAEYLVIEENRMEEKGLPSPENYVELQNWFKKIIQYGLEAFASTERKRVEVWDGEHNLELYI